MTAIYLTSINIILPVIIHTGSGFCYHTIEITWFQILKGKKFSKDYWE